VGAPVAVVSWGYLWVTGVLPVILGFWMIEQNKKRRREREERKKEHQELVDAIRGHEDAPPAQVEPSQPARAATAGHRHNTSAISRWRARQ
jgi:hypothetical protein